MLADHRWFTRDDWSLLAGRDVSLDGLFTPLLRTQLLAVPILLYRGMWTVFGARSYVPYLILAVAVHLGVAVVLRVVLRRIGVGPWLATAGASILVLAGQTQEVYAHAVQLAFSGSLLLGFAQLLLADHEGPLGRRDAVAAVFGVLGVLCSLVGVPMAVVVAAVLLVRHGWRSAVLQAAPAAIVVLVWALVTGPRSVSTSGPPDLETIVRWVGWSIEGTLEVLGHFPVVGMAMAVITVGGLALSLRDARVDPAAPGVERVRQRLRPVALPIAGLGGVLLFSLITVRGRWPFGEDAATSDRYLYVMAALAIPALCAAAEAVARRWEGARLPLVLLLLLPIPFNVRGFDDPPFNSAFFERQEAMIAGAVDHPLAEDVPSGIHPPGWDPTMSRALTMDFLFEAPRAVASVPEVTASPALTEEMAIRFIVYQDSIAGERTDCRTIDGPTEIEPRTGDVLHIVTPLRVSLADSATEPPVRVRFHPRRGAELRFQVGGIPVVLAPPVRVDAVEVCSVEPLR